MINMTELQTDTSGRRLNFRAVSAIASKDFADRLHEKSTTALIILISAIVFVYAPHGGTDFVQMIAIFFPLIGIVLGYDALLSETEGKSMNVLLTHPVFRDSVILGKFLAICMTLFCIVFVSLLIVTALDFILSGGIADAVSLFRLFLFGVFTFFYMLIFASFGLLTSALFKSSISSLTAGVVVWINMCFVLGPTVITLASLMTGVSMFDSTPEFVITISRLFAVSPNHHFSQVTVGALDLSYNTFNIQHSVNGFLDTRYALTYLLPYYGKNVLYLILAPFMLLAGAYAAFMRKDI